MAGMPGLLVARVFSGAHVITVTEPPPEPPVAPGTMPQPAAREAHARRAQAGSRVLLTDRVRVGRNVPRELRLPVMLTHDSVTSPTR
ncbi:hypothetical protein TNCT6_34370 [Streptomyces sp. 6-11-2]|nr:hypothetical protein TNCT6_34370 [Streptomyces sp. 6-11-2]